MSSSYRLGLLIVGGVFLASSLFCAVTVGTSATVRARAGQDLGQSATNLGEFQLTERSGRAITRQDFRDKVAIVSFIFTRCPLSCPKITSVMKSLQEKLIGRGVWLVSLSVDPEYDTPAVLSEYAKRFDASPDRWWFLTGPKAMIRDIVIKRFRVGLMDNPEPEKSPTTEAIFHSERLALVDRGSVVGLFDSTEKESIDALIAAAERRALPEWVLALPKVNASLNGLSALLLLAGWITITSTRRKTAAVQAGSAGRAEISSAARRGVVVHVTLMLMALATSTLFLGCYLLYHFKAGSMPFAGGGMARFLYFNILISHTLLATFGVVPLVLVTLYRAWKRDFIGHVRVAQVTFPIWLYVAVTGVVIYLMLYQMPVSTVASSL